MQDRNLLLKKNNKNKMKNWKFDLFNFKQSLTLDQFEISTIIEGHLQQFDKFSEKELSYSLKESLSNYSYDSDVKSLVENMEEELEAKPLLYSLKDLYKKVERKNFGMLYREALSKILDVINKDSDESRMESIVNELALYDWVPEVKVFVLGLTSDPREMKNMTSNGSKGESVYTVVTETKDGHIAYVGDRWFILSNEGITEAVLSDYVEGDELNILYAFEKAKNVADFTGDRIEFRVDENLTVSLGTNGKVYINGDEADKETTLEDLFNSPVIPMMKKNYYAIVKTVSENLDKIVELDVVQEVNNVTKALTELFVFNYKDKLYLYNVDKRTGSSFFEYDSVTQLIEDVQREMGYDVSHFVENKLSKELKKYKKLEDKEIEIENKIKEVQESLEDLETESELLTESTELKEAFDNLVSYKENLMENLGKVKNQKVAERKKLNS